MSNRCAALPRQLYTAASARALDRLAIEQYHIPGIKLMNRAGDAAFRQLREQWPQAREITVYCGPGNNGGDGYVVAELAQRQGLEVNLILVADVERVAGDARLALDSAIAAGLTPQPFNIDWRPSSGVVVDALLGIGVNRQVQGDMAAAITTINSCGLPVLALDVPSGLCSDTGRQWGVAVRADHTCTFIAVKQGLLTGRGPVLSGQLHFNDLEVPAQAYGQVPAQTVRSDPADLPRWLPARALDAHKGSFGHVLVIGGDYGYAGAALLAAEAAARCGAGLVSVATRAEHVAAMLARRPELMVRGVDQPAALAPLLARASCVVVGPGLGQDDWGRGLLQAALEAELPTVIDADGLNWLSQAPFVGRRAEHWLLTPHPGEAGRLLQCSTAEVQQDRFAALARLQQRYGGAVVLKGLGSLSMGGDGKPPVCCPYGNPGMASGGMGDVLSGLLGALLAQGLALADAAHIGVLVHALAADQLAASGQRGLLAGDLQSVLRRLVNP